MFAIIIVSLLGGARLNAMDKCLKDTTQQEKITVFEPAKYTDQDREHIINMVACLKQGHLSFPVADAIFKASIKHALLDAKDLLPPNSAQSVDPAVTAALANIARAIKQFAPRKEFLDTVELLLEGMDDRYEEEAKPHLRDSVIVKGSDGSLPIELGMQLAYIVAHYDQFNQKDLKHMVHLHKRAPEMLQEKLDAIPKDTIQSWYAQFIKGEPAA